MHTVIERDCTGCELCVEPCPVDCIEMVDVNPSEEIDLTWRWDDYSPQDTTRARSQTNNKLVREKKRQQARSSVKKLKELRKEKGTEQIKLDIAAAINRVKSKENN